MKVVIIMTGVVLSFLGVAYLIGYFAGDFAISLRLFSMAINLIYIFLSLFFVVKLIKNMFKKDAS